MQLLTCPRVLGQSHVDPVALVSAAVVGAATFAYLRSALRILPAGNVHFIKRSRTLVGFLLGSVGDVFTGEPGKQQAPWFAEAAEKVPVATGAGQAIALICQPDDLHYILFENPSVFPKEQLYDKLVPLLGRGLVTILNEKEHTAERKKCSPAFSTGALRRIADTIMTPILLRLVRDIETLADQRDGAVPGKCIKASVEEVVQADLLEIIMLAALRSDKIDAVREMGKLLRRGFSPLLYLVPWIMFRFPIQTQTYRTITGTRAIIQSSVRDAIHSITAEVDGNFDAMEEKERSLIDRLVLACPPGDMAGMQRVEDHGVTFVFAGQDTTAVALNWIFYRLAKHGHHQQRLLEELSDCFGLRTAPNLDDLCPEKMPFLNAVIYETLRLHPPVTDVGKVAAEDVVLPSGAFLPKGTQLFLFIFFVHRWKPLWGEDAGVFRPERWLQQENGGVDLMARVSPCGWMPFSAGKRNCIGKEFAMNELRLATAIILRNIDFEWPDDEPEPVLKHMVVTKPDAPMHFHLRVRRE